MTSDTSSRVSVDCIFCNVDSTLLYAKAKSLYDERWFDVVQCQRCGLVYTNPQIANKTLEIQERSSPGLSVIDEASRKSDQRVEVELRELERFSNCGSLLDFGCGAGVLVHKAVERGWHAVGVDINGAMIRTANEYWGDELLIESDLDALVRSHAGAFDAIISTNVFEHLSNPRQTLEGIRLLLKPGGVVYITVPSIQWLRERIWTGSTLDPTAHFYYFGTKTLKMLLECVGFQVLRCSGTPGCLGLWRSLFRSSRLSRVAMKLAVLTRRLPLPAIGSNVYAIGRLRDVNSSCEVARNEI